MRNLAIITCTCLLAACSETPAPPPGPDKPPTVLTTFYPTQYFAQRIAGDHAVIHCPVPGGADPIFWRPDTAALQQYQAADLIITNGAEFEKWIATASLPESRVVDTTKSLEQDLITFEGATTHRHGPAGEHSHVGIDGHTWLDPVIAKTQAAAIHQAFAKRWPGHAADFESNFQALVADLDSLDGMLERIDPDQPMLASHPAYNYLARRYGWKVTSLDLDPEAPLDESTIPAGHPAKIILWESRPTDATIKLLEQDHGLKSVVFSPAELRGEQDYLATMKANISALSAALAAP